MPGTSLAKLGILAGGGQLPKDLIKACRDTGRPFFVLAFRGQTPSDVTDDLDDGQKG
ncbi:MAG: hypothetical protein ACPGNT_01985, partial [Rhodospirillales bacterium]